MKNIKRVFNATRGKWVKVICKDEPTVKAPVDLQKAFREAVLGPVPKLPDYSRAADVTLVLITKMESFSDAFEALARGPEQHKLVKQFGEFIREAATVLGYGPAPEWDRGQERSQGR